MLADQDKIPKGLRWYPNQKDFSFEKVDFKVKREFSAQGLLRADRVKFQESNMSKMAQR